MAYVGRRQDRVVDRPFSPAGPYDMDSRVAGEPQRLDEPGGVDRISLKKRSWKTGGDPKHALHEFTRNWLRGTTF